MPSSLQAGCAFKSVVEVDRCLHYLLISKLPGDDQQFKVKGEPLDREQWHDLFENLTAEKFEPCLSIADLDPEQSTDKQLIDKALETPRGRVMDVGHWMALRTDNSIAVKALHHCDEAPDVARI